MAFPDRIERTVTLTCVPREVWQALTTADGLSVVRRAGEHRPAPRRRGHDDLRGRHDGRYARRAGRGTTVFAYTWRLPDLPEDDPRRTYVSSPWSPTGTGPCCTSSNRLRPASRRHPRETYDSHSEGWSRELAELAEHVMAPDIEAVADRSSLRLLTHPPHHLAALATDGPSTATDLAARLPITFPPSPSTSPTWSTPAWSCPSPVSAGGCATG